MMHVSINKQTINFQNFFGVYLFFARKSVKARFLATHASTGNTALCLGHHVTRELQAEHA
jgi:hypothetical protein